MADGNSLVLLNNDVYRTLGMVMVDTEKVRTDAMKHLTDLYLAKSLPEYFKHLFEIPDLQNRITGEKLPSEILVEIIKLRTQVRDDVLLKPHQCNVECQLCINFDGPEAMCSCTLTQARKWVCSDCGETFMDPKAAKLHFGAEGAVPACKLDPLAELRRLEKILATAPKPIPTDVKPVATS